ncbi:MAG TPA: VOC family protein [Chloroflexota bacterium]|nr:VOC family protein [Chloroflexota bacterium]
MKRIELALLFVADLERSKAFYQDTLGLSLTFEDAYSAFFQMEGTALGLLTIAGAQDLLTAESVATQHPAKVSGQLVSFVEDVDAVYADLVAKGVEFVREPVDRAWGMRTAHFRDPDGNIWEIARETGVESNEG